jgi:uroporphyrinogen decarboxylase
MELFMNGPLHARVVEPETMEKFAGHPRRETLFTIQAFRNLGYDYATVRACDFKFPVDEIAHKNTISLNDGSMITDRESFEKYPWPEVGAFPFGRLELTERDIPEGMKFIVIGPGGVLENAIRLVGYERLCMMTYDDPQLVGDIFSAVGSRLVEYYRRAVEYRSVGAVWVNDDWGFKTQVMLAPDDMRRYVIPWHRRIAEAVHAAGRPTVMHSCGCLDSVMDDITGIIRHDGKHSYEDTIHPVEEAYEQLHGRIAVIGGMDVDFVCRSRPEEVYRRSRAMIERAAGRGGYALGTGNSVPEYIPHENYFAMLAAAWEDRPGYRLPRALRRSA